MKNEKKIKIAFFIDFLVSKDGLMGGTETQLIELINNIKAHNCEPILFSLRSYYKEEVLSKVACDVNFLDLYSLKSLDFLKKLITVSIYLKREHVDVVQTFFFDSSVFGVICAKLAGINKIVTSRRDLGFWYNRNIVLGFKILNKFTDRVLVNAEAVKKSTLEKENIIESKVCVINNGINYKEYCCIERFPLENEFIQIKSTDKIVGIVANFNRSVKRLDLFIKGAKKVCEQFSNVKFIIIGGGVLEPELKSLGERLLLKDKIIFAGPRRDAKKYIYSFDIGVLTSDSEGFSNTLLEYMAAGIPAVVTAVGGNVEIIEHGKAGILFQPGNEDELSGALLLLLKNEQLRKDMGKNGKLIVKEKYDWNVVAEKMTYFYQNLIS